MKKRFVNTLIQSPDDGSGAGAGGNGKSAENALIERVKNLIAEEVRSLEGDEKFKENLIKAFSATTDAQFRAYDTDKEKLKNDVVDLAAKLGKLEQRGFNAPANHQFESSFLEAAIEERFSEIENIINGRNVGSEYIIEAKRAAQIITTDNAVDLTNVEKEALAGTTITSFTEKRTDWQFIFDFADRTTVSNLPKNKVWYSEGDEEGAFAEVAEGGLKPMVSVSLVANSSAAKKVAGKTVYTDEVPKFKQEAYQIIRRLINDKLLREYQSKLTTELTTAAASYVGSALDGQYSNPTDFHAIAAVAAQIESLNFLPDVLILNPQDRWRMGMSQDSVGAFFMLVPSTNPAGQPTLMGFRVITSNIVPVGKFILGESKLWKIEDESVTIKIGYGITTTKDGANVTDVQHDLDHNRFRIIAEIFYHSYIDSAHTGSFVQGDFDVIKELLTKEAEEEVEG